MWGGGGGEGRVCRVGDPEAGCVFCFFACVGEVIWVL